MTYTRTSGSRNKVNKRIYRPVEHVPGARCDSKGRQYLVTPTGALVRVLDGKDKR